MKRAAVDLHKLRSDEVLATIKLACMTPKKSRCAANGGLDHEKSVFSIQQHKPLGACSHGLFVPPSAMNTAPSHGVGTNPQALSAFITASESYSIVASQDIVDVRGLKLWAKGNPVSSALQQRLLDRKLKQPLEACLLAEDGVTVFTLHHDLKTFLEQDTPLTLALRPWASLLLAQVKQLPLHSVAQLLLTTALATRPTTLPHAVTAMALAGAIASGRFTGVDVRLAMLGGLLHDVGEVYIQPEYLDHGTALDSVGHKHLVVHPRVAQMLLDATTDYPKALCLAIGEHHERLDGSGYPARLSGQQVSPLGRLLAVVEVTMGLLRNPQAPLNRASFALRVVPGEFDPQWGGQVSDMARAAGEVLPPAAAHSRAEQLLPMTLIDRRLHQTQELAQTLKNQGRTGPFFEIMETALLRLNRLRVAWNALGFWGLDASQLSCQEAFELQLAGAELQQRLRALQRECMLLCERLGELEKNLLEPLWHGLLDGRVKV